MKWHKIGITGNVVKEEGSRPTLAKINKNIKLKNNNNYVIIHCMGLGKEKTLKLEVPFIYVT